MQIYLYLDQGTTLSTFQRLGTLDREMAVYRRLTGLGHHVTVLSWAKGEDDFLLSRLAPIKVVQNTSRLPNRIWMVLKLFQLRQLRNAKVLLLTNQLHGAYLPAIISVLVGYRFVLRFGFLTSANYASDGGQRSLRYWSSLLNEFLSAMLAETVVTTTRTIAAALSKRAPWIKRKIRVIPNYIDETVFFPIASSTKHEGPFRVVSTGRLSPEKQYEILIRAVAKISGDAELLLIGEGLQRKSLQDIADSLNVTVEFLGQQDNARLRDIYSSCNAFVLCSKYEGHPKALIEAMACGMPVVGTNVRGIRDVVTNGENGILVEGNADAIAAALVLINADSTLRGMLSKNAATFARAFGLDVYVRTLDEALTRSQRA